MGVLNERPWGERLSNWSLDRGTPMPHSCPPPREVERSDCEPLLWRRTSSVRVDIIDIPLYDLRVTQRASRGCRESGARSSLPRALFERGWSAHRFAPCPLWAWRRREALVFKPSAHPNGAWSWWTSPPRTLETLLL